MGKNSPWWLGLIQGLVALGLGLFLVLDRGSASLIIGLLAAIYLLVAGIIHTIRGFGLRSDDKGSVVLIRGIVGLVIGAILLAFALFNVGTLQSGYTILAVGLIIFGALGLFTSFFQRGNKGFAWGPVLVNLALLVLGILVFFSRSQGFDLALVSGWILILVGAVILLWTILGRKDASEAAGDVP